MSRVETLPGVRCHSELLTEGKAWEFLYTSILKSLESRGARSSFWSETRLRPILQSLYFGTEMRGDVMESRKTRGLILKRGPV